MALPKIRRLPGSSLNTTGEPACQADQSSLLTPIPPPIPDSDWLKDHTSLRVGGQANRFIVATSEAELIEAVQDCDQRGEPLLVLGSGTNLLVADDGFPGAVVRVATRGLTVDLAACAGAYLTVAAGEIFDAIVAETLDQQWIGLETLSGIPGTTGATVIQNAGAYGSEVAEQIARVKTYDRHQQAIRTFFASDCDFGYRTSRFKRQPGRYVILQVDFQLRLGPASAPIRYAELARHLGIQVGERAPLAEVRQAVLELRRAKGMVLDAKDHDTWSAGSFFTNPLLTSEQAAALPVDAPRYEQVDGRIKTSAAWLIEQAGFGKGFALDTSDTSGSEPQASLSQKHVLALTNRGQASAGDIIALARAIRAGVEQRFGITLEVEPVQIGVEV